MAKFTFTATATAVVFFCLFAVPLARTPPQKDDATTAISLPFSDPVEAEDSDAATGTEITAVTTAPLIEDTFRPVNRHFHVRPKHVCGHYLRRLEIPYGNDMMVSSGEGSDLGDPEMIHGGDRRRARLHHHLHPHDDEDSDGDSDSDDEEEEEDGDDRIAKIMVKRYNHHRYDREKLKELKKMKEKQKKCCFMRRVRKFLDHYF